MSSITRPGVEVTQKFVTESVTIAEPALPTCIIGPCYQVVDAFDDEGDPQDTAYAGTYQDNYGRVGYDLPNLVDDGDLSSTSDGIRVFLTLGAGSTELNSESGETEITSSTTSCTYTYDSGTGTAEFYDELLDADNLGVELGDVVRVTFQGIEYDLVVSGPVDGDGVFSGGATLEVDKDAIQITEDAITFSAIGTIPSYEILRDPAQFVYKSSAEEATAILTDDEEDGGSTSADSESDYLTISTQSTGDYAGQKGDSLTLVIAEASADDSGTDGVSGSSLFIEGGGGLFAALGGVTAAGAVSNYFLIFDGAADGAGDSLTEVTHAITDESAALEADGLTAGETTKGWVIGSLVGTAGTAFDSYVQSTLTLTDTGAFTDVDTSGGTYYVEITNTGGGSGVDGTYLVASATDDTLVLDGAVGTVADMTAGTYTVILRTSADATGATGSTSQFSSPTMSLSSAAIAAIDEYFLVSDSSSTDVGVAGSTYDADSNILTTGSATGSGASLRWAVTSALIDVALTVDVGNNTVTVTMPRNATGLSPLPNSGELTFSALVTAITDEEAVGTHVTTASVYNSDVAAAITAVATGTDGEVHTGHIGSHTFDGGVDGDGLVLDADLLGSSTPTAKVYVSYKALRVDVSDQGDDASLLTFDTTTALEDTVSSGGLEPISTDNPLALGMYFALLNAPGQSVKGLGVSEVSSSEPNGTSDAYTSALAFLEGENVYTLVPLTEAPDVHALFDSHVTEMSAAENKGERIVFFSSSLPGYSAATLLASGTAGNSGSDFATSGEDGYALFTTDTDFANTSDVTDAITAAETLVLVVAANAASTESPTNARGTVTTKYGMTVDAVSSTSDYALDLTTDVAAMVTALETTMETAWESMVDVTWALYSIGSVITDSSDVATALASIGTNYGNRRTFLSWPPKATATLDGSDTFVEGHYLASGWAGKVSEDSPSQGFTNTSVKGFTSLRYSNGYFSESQLNEIAGGGTFISVQGTTSGPITCRHQLSTDPSSVQKRELSITKTVDYTAKLFRNALAPKIGKFNINSAFLDSLATQVQGLISMLVQTQILTSAQLTLLEADEDSPDTVNITLLIDVPYPCNYIALTLQI